VLAGLWQVDVGAGCWRGGVVGALVVVAHWQGSSVVKILVLAC
jgi:hypothetical protein